MAKKRWFGSINNRIDEERSENSPVVPVVGMPATLTHYTDRTAATVTKVRSPSTIELKRVPVTKWEHCYGVEFGEPEGEPLVAIRRRNGGWKIKGEGAPGVLLGKHDAYNDPSF